MRITTPSLPCRLISVPVQDGAGHPGCAAGPEALLAVGLTRALRALGHRVEVASVTPGPAGIATHRNPAVVGLPQIAAWTAALAQAAFEASATTRPIFLGGDHSLSAGTLSGMARRAAQLRRPLFVLCRCCCRSQNTAILLIENGIRDNLTGTAADLLSCLPLWG